MDTNFSVIAFEETPGAEESAVRYYSLTNSLMPPPAHVSLEHPVLSKGMLWGICLKGRARLRINFKEYTLLPNSIFTVLPNQVFESMEKSKDHYTECLFFSSDFVKSLPLPRNLDILNKMTLSPCLPVSEENMKKIIEYHSFIKEACDKDKGIANEIVIKSLMHALIALLASLYEDVHTETELKNNSRGITIVENFTELLIKYHKTERKASFYADKLCITTPYLSRTLKELTGKSVNSWITEAVVLKAKALLKSTDTPILQISEELNFPNPSFFIRYFKQYAGTTPLKYRES